VNANVDLLLGVSFSYYGALRATSWMKRSSGGVRVPVTRVSPRRLLRLIDGGRMRLERQIL